MSKTENTNTETKQQETTNSTDIRSNKRNYKHYK